MPVDKQACCRMQRWSYHCLWRGGGIGRKQVQGESTASLRERTASLQKKTASLVSRAMVSGRWNKLHFQRGEVAKIPPGQFGERLLQNKTQQPTAANLFGVTEVLRGFTGKEGSVKFWEACHRPKPICLKCKDEPPPTNPHLFFDNPPLCYNLLNNHLFAFRQRLLKFQYQAIFIIEEYVKQ